MTSKNLKTNTNSLSDSILWNSESIYEHYLQQKYGIPKNHEILIKQGYVVKEKKRLTERERFIESQSEIEQLIQEEIKSDLLKISGIIEESVGNIEILEIQNSSRAMNDNLLKIEVSSEAEEMFSKLSSFVKKFTDKIYRKTYELSVDSFNDILGITPNLFDMPELDKEIRDKINLWIENLKKRFLNKIENAISESSDDESLSEVKNYIQKGFVSDFFEGVKEFFVETGNKIGQVMQNIASNVQAAVSNIAMKISRIDRYEIILSSGENICELCQNMAGEVYLMDELKIGETAPPFHPNCRCKIIPRKPNPDEEVGSLPEPLVIAANLALEALSWLPPGASDLYEKFKKAIYDAGVAYLGKKRYNVAKELFHWGMYGKGEGLPEKTKNMLIDKLKKSETLKKKIKEYTKHGKDFSAADESIHFRLDEPDLHYSVQRAYLELNGKKLDDKGNWDVRVKLRDKYDFTQFRNGLNFSDIANNLVEAMQRNGMMREFTTEVEFSNIYKD